MKNLTIILSLISTNLFSQVSFEKNYSLFQNPQMYFVQELKNGGYIVCGKCLNAIDSTTDFCFFKADAAGNINWSNQFEDTTIMYGFPTDEWATTIREKTDGSFVFGGSVKDPDYGYSVAFYGWMDSNGILQSSTSKSSNWTTSVNAMLLNDDGNIISTRDDREGAGHYYNYLEVNSPSAQFISGSDAGNFSIANQALVKMFDGGYATVAIQEAYYSEPGYQYIPIVSRFDTDGNEIWNFPIHSEVYSGDMQFTSLCTTPDSGILICGYVSGNNIILTKLNSNGDSLWTKSVSSSGIPSAIQNTSDGGYAILGTLNNSVMLLKLDANEDSIWMQTYNNSNGNASGIYFQQTEDNGFILLGKIENGGPETIYLIKTDSNGIANTITKTGKVDPVRAFNLYPDPFLSSININIPGNRSCYFSICDMTGKIVFSKKITGENDRIDLSFLSPGFYCALFPFDGIIKSKRIMKVNSFRD